MRGLYSYITVLFGLFLILFGVVFGVYVGLWVCFIGGIVQIVTQVSNMINHVPVDAMKIALGIVKIIFAGVIGWLSAIVPISFGLKLIK